MNRSTSNIEASTSRPTERNPRIVAREIVAVLTANGHPIDAERVRILSRAYCSDRETVNISVGAWIERRGDLIVCRPKPRASDPRLDGRRQL